MCYVLCCIFPNGMYIPSPWFSVILGWQYTKGSRTECNTYRGITLLSTPGKAFALMLLARVKTKLLEVRRPEQSGFTPHMSTVHRVATLNTLLQTRREFSKLLWVAYVDLKSAFDSVDRESLWLLLRRRGIPDKLVKLMKELYAETRTAYWQMECALSGSRSSAECVRAAPLLLIYS